MRCFLLVATGLFIVPAAADDIEKFYQGRQIQMFVGSAVGSGYDINARAVARHYGRHIPGSPSVIVQNQPGAGGLIMTNSLANTAPKDGTAIGATINGVPTAHLLQPSAVRFDPTKLNWIGSSNRDLQVFYVWHDVPVHKLEDILTKEIVVGATTRGTSTVDFPLVANKILGLRLKIVSGYSGTAQIHKAMESGEVQGVPALAWASLRTLNSDWLANKKIKILAQWNMPPRDELADVPSVSSLAKSDIDRAALRLLTSRLEAGRPFLAPANVPADRVAALRQAFDQTMKDPAFLTEATKLNLDISPMTGQEITSLVDELSAIPESVIEKVRNALNEK